MTNAFDEDLIPGVIRTGVWTQACQAQWERQQRLFAAVRDPFYYPGQRRVIWADVWDTLPSGADGPRKP